MASSSVTNFCFHCDQSSPDPLQQGWDLTTGRFAQLCNTCYSIYKAGEFCNTFHTEQEDWKDCQFCGKPIHCSCLVSYSEWELLQGGQERVICAECSKITSFQERIFSNVADLEEMKEFKISWFPKCAIVPMFEKLLSVGDVDNKYGSIIIPKKHAEAYLPEVTDPKGVLLYLCDDKGVKEWNAHFRYWLNKMYVVDDLKEYMVSNKLRGGDTLTFSRLLPDGPYIIGFRKA